MELLQNLTDDQTALLGCLVALMAAIGLLAISFHANPANKTRKMPEVKHKPEAKPAQRRAA